VHINLSGGNYKSLARYLKRNLSQANYVRIIEGIRRRYPSTNFIITTALEDTGMGERISSDLGSNVLFYRDTSIQELVSLMKLASMVITPETAVSHIASVLNKRLVTLFFADRQMRDWRPFSDEYRCVIPRRLPLVWTIDGQQVADAALELLEPGELQATR
jgi:ADP-heptose:LPS heptosyltransferase